MNFYRRHATADFPDRARARVDPGGDVRAEPPALAQSQGQLQTSLPPLLLQMSGPRNFLSLWVESKSGFPHGGRTGILLLFQAISCDRICYPVEGIY